MDGRRFRRWWLYGGLLAGVVGCNRGSTYTGTFGLPKAGQPVGAVVPGGKPAWGGGAPPAPGQPPNGMPAEVSTAKPRKGGKGFSPDAEVALADTQVAAAFADPPVANPDQMLDMARHRYQKALKEDPKNKGALLGMARLYARLGDKEHALAMYKKYMELYPKDHEAAYGVAVSHARWGDFGGAVGWCDEALKGDPENRTYRKHKAFFLAHAGKWEESFQAMCGVLPEHEARLRMAQVLAEHNYLDQSRQQVALALQQVPEFAAAREFLAALDNPTPQQPPQTAGEANPVRQAGYAPQP